MIIKQFNPTNITFRIMASGDMTFDSEFQYFDLVTILSKFEFLETEYCDEKFIGRRNSNVER